MEREELLTLLGELVACLGPAGEEREVEQVLLREFRATGVEVWQDDATNVYAHLPGSGPKVMVCAHKDELGMAITYVDEDGRLGVENCGGSRPCWRTIRGCARSR